MTHEQLIAKVHELVARELDVMEKNPLLAENGLDNLAKIALIIQRTKLPPAPSDPESSTQVPAYSNEKLMKTAGGPINE